MSKPIFENTEQITKRAEQYFKDTKLVAPASFRIYMGYTKQNLQSWKINKKEDFYLIKSYERKILAKIEEYAIYGQAHPDIKNTLVIATEKETFYADKFDKNGKVIAKGSIKSKSVDVVVTGKYNQVGAMFILKAYNTDLYTPELRVQQKAIEHEPIIIQGIDLSTKKLPLSINKALKATIEEPATVDGQVKES